MTDLLDTLAAHAFEAAPSRPSGPHLDRKTLARLRGDDEVDDKADAYRHLASCAQCRNAMRRVGMVPSSRKPVVWLSTFAVAAALVLASMSLLRDPAQPRFAVRQRAYAANMGGGAPVASAQWSSADLDVELSFTAASFSAATLLVFDESGRAIAPPRSFERAADGTFRLVIAPRTFLAHSGAAIGVVLAGDVTDVATAVRAALAGEPLDEIARRHRVAFERTTLR